MFKQVTIMGPGLLGASLVLAIREKSLAESIVIWARSEQTAEKARKKLPGDRVETDPAKSVVGSDMVIICTPVETMSSIFSTIVDHLAKGCLVTDVGSVKGVVCEKAKTVFKSPGVSFIGSHPMAGSEKAGMENARVQLFKDRPTIITPESDCEQKHLEKLKEFWQSLGMVVHQLSSEEHDQAVASLSHLPHLISSALSFTISEQAKLASELSGQGLRDTIRISGGDPSLWAGIFSENKAQVLSSLKDFEDSIQIIKDLISKDERKGLEEFLKKGSLLQKSVY
jgi:prephenate dehydrogenase